MARNQEKAQSMLYRFREAQAAELGISLGRSKDTRRPRLASSCKDLRECERWRGDILREISRKVSKIQDSGLTDYEVRDLNDEINKLLREKFHWENQIIALGGANYKRSGVVRIGGADDGREVRGNRGYKYFGRAKELPGVKELLESGSRNDEQAEEEERRQSKYRRFLGQPPEYRGDMDEEDGVLLEEEYQREVRWWRGGLERRIDGGDDGGEDGGGGGDGVGTVLGHNHDDSTPPPLPRRQAENIRLVMSNYAGGDIATSDTTGILPHLLPALDPEQLSTASTQVPTRKDIEAVILRERKKALREEYLG